MVELPFLEVFNVPLSTMHFYSHNRAGGSGGGAGGARAPPPPTFWHRKKKEGRRRRKKGKESVHPVPDRDVYMYKKISPSNCTKMYKTPELPGAPPHSGPVGRQSVPK